MNERKELAKVIVAAYGEDAETECPCEQDLDVATAILAAGYRKITLDDATIERAARALYGTEELPIYDEAREVFTGTKPFDWLSAPFQDSYRIKAKAVLGAAIGGTK